MEKLDHKHIILTAKIKKPPTDVATVEDWLRRLVAAVDMKILFGPMVTKCETPGNVGVTGIVCIETSHASIHVWEEETVPFVKLDLYSCKAFDNETVISMLKEFDPYYYSYAFIDRNEDIKILERGDVQVQKIMDLLTPDKQKLVREHQRKKNDSPEALDAVREYNRFCTAYSINKKRNRQQYAKDGYAKLAAIKAKCNKHDIPFNLTSEWMEENLSSAKTKWPELIVAAESKPTFWSASVDRIDPSMGYLQNNCRIIPHGLNVAKLNWKPQELQILVDLLAKEVYDSGESEKLVASCQ